MEAVKQLRNHWFFSLKVGLLILLMLIIGVAGMYNRQVILYQEQLNLLVNYIYDEISPDQVISVYQRFINLDSYYGDRIKKELGPSLVSRYQYYANLYMLRKIEYEEYLQYEQIVEPLFFSNDKVMETIEEVQLYYQSQRAYIKGMNLEQQGLIEEAIEAYRQVLFNDETYYSLAQTKIKNCIQSIKEQYLAQASLYYEQKNYTEAIKCLNYLLEHDQDETISSLRWYYQSEFYTDLMKEIEVLIESDQLGYVINYLIEIKPYLGTQYEPTLDLTLSELTLKQAQRRDKALSKYAPKIQVLVSTESNHQIITSNLVTLPSSTTFNPVSLATNTFTSVKKYATDLVDEVVNDEVINMMPYLVANHDLTSATFPVMFGYYGETMNDFDELQLYIDQELIYSSLIDETHKRQVWIDSKVVEWVTVEFDLTQLKQLEKLITAEGSATLVFKGKYLEHVVEVSDLERELCVMMLEIYQAIIK